MASVKIVKTVGPRGYKPKYGVTETGEVIELYEGDLIKETGGSSDTFNDEFINLPNEDLPSFLTGQNPFRGGTDQEKIEWLKSEMMKMQKLALIYLDKIKEISKNDPELSSIVASSLVLAGGVLLKANPVVGVVVTGVGTLITFLSKSTQHQILEYKKEKILKWSAVIATLQNQYAAYSKEITRLQSKVFIKIGLAIGIIAILKYL